jgi:26S proteasome regulatory subunit N2
MALKWTLYAESYAVRIPLLKHNQDEPVSKPSEIIEPSSSKRGQTEIKSGEISPIAGSMSNLNETFNNGTSENETKSGSKLARRREPPSERLPNFSRVTPAQLSHISFPADARYQPVRSLSPPMPSGDSVRGHMNLYAGGGGILLVIDQQPEQEVDFIEFEEDITMEDSTPLAETSVEESPEAPPPEPFEVSISVLSLTILHSNPPLGYSIPLITIHSNKI